jgi:lysozyme
MRKRATLGPAFLVVSAACSGPPSVEDVQSLSEPIGPTGPLGPLGPLEQCASQWVEGIDVFDGQGTVEWPAVRDAGVAFAFVKATQGTYDTQSTFAANWAGAKAAGVARGAYHFFDPTEDGAAQADHFLAVVGALAPGDLPAMLDLECPDGESDCVGTGQSGAADPSTLRARVDAFLEAVEQATGAAPILYTFPAYFTSSGVDASGLEGYPLFVANVGSSGGAASGACFEVPAPWAAATFWQYAWTGSIEGIQGPVDRDRYLGDLAGLAGLALPAAAPRALPAGCR